MRKSLLLVLMLFVATAINAHTVTMMKGNAVYNTVQVSNGRCLSDELLEAPSIEPFYLEFAGWSVNADGSPDYVTPNTPITSDITLYASWYKYRPTEKQVFVRVTNIDDLGSNDFIIVDETTDNVLAEAPYVYTVAKINYLGTQVKATRNGDKLYVNNPTIFWYDGDNSITHNWENCVSNFDKDDDGPGFFGYRMYEAPVPEEEGGVYGYTGFFIDFDDNGNVIIRNRRQQVMGYSEQAIDKQKDIHFYFSQDFEQAESHLAIYTKQYEIQNSNEFVTDVSTYKLTSYGNVDLNDINPGLSMEEGFMYYDVDEVDHDNGTWYWYVIKGYTVTFKYSNRADINLRHLVSWESNDASVNGCTTNSITFTPTGDMWFRPVLDEDSPSTISINGTDVLVYDDDNSDERQVDVYNDGTVIAGFDGEKTLEYGYYMMFNSASNLGAINSTFGTTNFYVNGLSTINGGVTVAYMLNISGDKDSDEPGKGRLVINGPVKGRGDDALEINSSIEINTQSNKAKGEKAGTVGEPAISGFSWVYFNPNYFRIKVPVNGYIDEMQCTIVDGNGVPATHILIERIPQYLLGDVNDDKSVTMSDANIVTNYFTGAKSDDIILEAADMNSDYTVTMADANAIVNVYVSGK